MKPEQRVDILLWRSGFLKTPKEYFDYIRKSEISINTQKAKRLYLIKTHSLISFNFQSHLKLKKYLKKIRSKYLSESVSSFYPLYIQKDCFLFNLKYLYSYETLSGLDQTRTIHNKTPINQLKKMFMSY